MGQATFTLTGLPAEGDRYMTTGDLGEFYGRLRAFQDDGTAEVTAKLAMWSGKVRWIKATISPPDPVSTPWEEMMAEARMAAPALEPPQYRPDSEDPVWNQGGSRAEGSPDAVTTHIYDGSPPEAWMPGDPPAKPEGSGGDTLTGIPAVPPGQGRARLTRRERGSHARQ